MNKLLSRWTRFCFDSSKKDRDLFLKKLKSTESFKVSNGFKNERLLDELDASNYLFKREKKLFGKNLIDDPDKFGTLTDEHSSISFNSNVSTLRAHSSSFYERDANEEKSEREYGKVLEHIRLSNEPDRPHTENYYANLMKVYAEKGQIDKAVSVFFDEMIEKDRYKPTVWLYKTLIKIVARAGYTHMAFSLFKRLTDSNEDDWSSKFKSTYLRKIITTLFVACANSPWPEYAIRKTDSIRFYLKNRNIQPNSINYAAMINAYGRAGAVYEAFNCVDEMILLGVGLDLDVFKNLLCACISSPSNGFKYALKAWQLCLEHKIKPDSGMYKLLLHCAVDSCVDIGNLKKVLNLKNIKRDERLKEIEAGKEMQKISSTNLDLETNNAESNELEDILDVSSMEVIHMKPDQVHVIDELEVLGKSFKKKIDNLEWWQDIKSNVNIVDLVEDLAMHKPELKDFMMTMNYDSLLTQPDQEIEKILANMLPEEDTPTGRFKMLGGLHAVLKSMQYHNVKPDLISFTLILQLLPNEKKNEAILLETMSNLDIKPDIEFINLLIKRSLFRKDLKNYERAILMIQTSQIAPNFQTFTNMAYRVQSAKLLNQYLIDLKEKNIKITPVMLSILMGHGFFHYDDEYLLILIEHVKSNNLKLEKKTADLINRKLDILKTQIIDHEKGIDKMKRLRNFEEIKRFFNNVQSSFDELMKTNLSEQNEHPYAKFARNDNDKLFYSFLKRTENLSLN